MACVSQAVAITVTSAASTNSSEERDRAISVNSGGSTQRPIAMSATNSPAPARPSQTSPMSTPEPCDSPPPTRGTRISSATAAMS